MTFEEFAPKWDALVRHACDCKTCWDPFARTFGGVGLGIQQAIAAEGCPEGRVLAMAAQGDGVVGPPGPDVPLPRTIQSGYGMGGDQTLAGGDMTLHRMTIKDPTITLHPMDEAKFKEILVNRRLRPGEIIPFEPPPPPVPYCCRRQAEQSERHEHSLGCTSRGSDDSIGVYCQKQYRNEDRVGIASRRDLHAPIAVYAPNPDKLADLLCRDEDRE